MDISASTNNSNSNNRHKIQKAMNTRTQQKKKLTKILKKKRLTKTKNFIIYIPCFLLLKGLCLIPHNENNSPSRRQIRWSSSVLRLVDLTESTSKVSVWYMYKLSSADQIFFDSLARHFVDLKAHNQIFQAVLDNGHENNHCRRLRQAREQPPRVPLTGTRTTTVSTSDGHENNHRGH
ncbi:hypothetical protein Fmac_005867 [Flemingia macrophylla]|uniref:Uncharacterized protein n=1 Tax=Flemingia macrophylla TaxID=520843 RepID=A0ABD1NA65_9FABA